MSGCVTRLPGLLGRAVIAWLFTSKGWRAVEKCCPPSPTLALAFLLPCPFARQEMSAALVAQGLNDKKYIWDREVTAYVQVRVNS